MPLREDIDGLRWTGVVGGEGRLHPESLVAWSTGMGLLAFLGAGSSFLLMLVLRFSDLDAFGWGEVGVAVGVLCTWLLGLAMTLLMAARSVMSLVHYEVELHVTDRGIGVRLASPLPWEVVAARVNWPGLWQGLVFAVPWEEVGYVEVKPSTGEVVLVGSCGEQCFRLIDASAPDLWDLREVAVNAHRVALLARPDQPPEPWRALPHRVEPVPWSQTVGNLARLRMGAAGVSATALPRGNSLATVEALRRRIGR
ncbi:MAG: hypothetical protein KC912_22245 [Proteobacteria bacterium]|nr:hypothetical protein [Pseudomonadota bacterium]